MDSGDELANAPGPDGLAPLLAEARAMCAQLATAQPLSVVQRAFDLGIACLESGDDRQDLEAALALARAIIADTRREATLIPANWGAPFQLGGVATLRLYEAGGSLTLLVDGIELLREAGRRVDPSQIDEHAELRVNLGAALTRLGEQTSDVAPLHEARAVLDQGKPFGSRDYRAANASAVAALNLGVMSGDSGLVEQAVRELQQFVADHKPTGEAADMCDRNLCAALVANARQLKSEPHYRKLIAILERKRTGKLDTVSERHYGQWLGSAQLELAQLELAEDPKQSRYAEQAVETLQPLVDTVTDRRMRIESLHQLGQARYRIGVSRQDPAILAQAIETLEQALAGCETDARVADARRPRLMADLAGYVLTLARLSGEGSGIAKARELYQAASEAAPIERAPALHAQIATGSLDLEFRAEQWAAVVAFGADIERALELAERDPRLSGGVRHQGARLRAGLAAKQARALIALGAPAEAGAALERARGRRLAVAQESWANNAPVTDEAAAALAIAEAHLRDALSGEDDTASRLAWDALSAARRRTGFDLSTRNDAREWLMRAAGPGSAFVQLSFTPSASVALLWLHGRDAPESLALPVTAYRAVARLFHTSSEGPGWIGHYRRYLAGGDAAAETWNHAIEDALRTLGREVLEPVDGALRHAQLPLGARVYLCPPGDLALLPVGAARLSDGARFNERWSACITPNAAILGANPSPVGAAICLGEWAADPDLANPLPGAVRECAMLVERVSGMHAIGRAQATPQHVVEAVRDARLIHAACHGVYDSDEPGRSGLELAGGARLTLARLAAQGASRISARLVFLSACEAGMSGLTLDTDEFVGLPAAFLGLGARGVIASLWAVADEAAAAFALRFYELYLDDQGHEAMSPAQALAGAQSWLCIATTEMLAAGGYLSREIAESIRHGPVMLRLRRGEGGESAPSGDERPFSDATHWAGWMLFGQ